LGRGKKKKKKKKIFLLLLLLLLGKKRRNDQVIRKNPASRGTETSTEFLVGPPWRMVSNAGQQQSPNDQRQPRERRRSASGRL